MNELLHRLLAGTTVRDTVVSLLDVLLVYYAIYRVLLLIKGTRAAQMVIGLVLIGAGFFAAKQFELATVSWLLDNLINYFIIIIIVVFQHDIRRGLVRIGQNLFNFGRTYEETHVFEEIIHAVERLAKARIGGIIVLEREADLSEFIETGEILDARVTKEMLVALFVPSRDNELHDGAVVVKNLRIQQAAAVLPLSSNAHLDKALGTRHRAAIGITEETDAVAVVVSEERGEISLSFHGNLARDLDAATLRKALLGLFFKEKRRKKDSQRGAERDDERAAAAQAAADALKDLVAEEGKPPPRIETASPIAAEAAAAAAAEAAEAAAGVADPATEVEAARTPPPVRTEVT